MLKDFLVFMAFATALINIYDGLLPWFPGKLKIIPYLATSIAFGLCGAALSTHLNF